jgi:hypothetical protein
MSTPVCLTSVSIFKTGRSDRNRATISHEPGVSLQDALRRRPATRPVSDRYGAEDRLGWTELSNGFVPQRSQLYHSSRAREPPAVEVTQARSDERAYDDCRRHPEDAESDKTTDSQQV